jgi:hypothetical protein
MFNKIFLIHVLFGGFQSASALMSFVTKVITFVTLNIGAHKWRKRIIIYVHKILSCFVAYMIIYGSLVYISTFQIVIS